MLLSVLVCDCSVVSSWRFVLPPSQSSIEEILTLKSTTERQGQGPRLDPLEYRWLELNGRPMGSHVQHHRFVVLSLIPTKATVQTHSLLFFSVLGDDVNIKDELLVNGASVLPHKSIRFVHASPGSKGLVLTCFRLQRFYPGALDCHG